MEIKSPLDGILTFNSNYQGGGLDAKPYKVGDNVYAGMVLGEIPDLNTLELEAKIEEIDRGRIVLNQEVRVRVDSLPITPEKVLRALEARGEGKPARYGPTKIPTYPFPRLVKVPPPWLLST